VVGSPRGTNCAVFVFVITPIARHFWRRMKLPALFFAVVCLLNAAARGQELAAPPLPPSSNVPTGEGEYIILCGGVSLMVWEKYKAQPHDNWWMNFVRASRLRIQQLQAANPNVRITLMVYRPSYIARAKQEKNDLLGHITSVRDAYGIKLVWFDSTDELINYLNSGQPRSTTKIEGFEFFGHSNRACWMFDYSSNLDSASKCWLHENDMKKINRGIFTRNAFIKSWSCHTGESMNKKFYAATGARMWGATGKTQYMTDELPVLSTKGGRWTR
jgi:hypothetical protein